MTTSSSSSINLVSAQEQCTIQSQEIGAETIALRCLDWDQDCFDIEFGWDNRQLIRD